MESIIIAIVGSGALSAVIAGIFNLIINRKGRLKSIEDKIDHLDSESKKSEKDALRTQLLLMLSDYPEEKTEILRLAERYFGVLKANWYMTTLFNNWLVKYKIAKPEWFNNKGGNNE